MSNPIPDPKPIRLIVKLDLCAGEDQYYRRDWKPLYDFECASASPIDIANAMEIAAQAIRAQVTPVIVPAGTVIA